MDLEVQRILNFLQRKKIRATYQAVGQRLNTPTRAVGGRLGPNCPLASWVVRADTGTPVGYAPTEIHPDLYTNDKIITDGRDLEFLMRRDFEEQQQKDV